LRNKLLFSIFVFFFISIFIALGSWQLVRLNWKNELLNKIDVSLKKEPVDLMTNVPEDYLKIKTSGVIDFDKQIYLYSLNEKGSPGFNVVNPIIINNKNFLLNRGWIPFNKKNTKEINIFDHKTILGTLKKQTKASRFKPANDVKDNYWFTLDRNDVFKYTNKNFSPFIIYLNNNLELPKPKIITVNIPNSHKKYAITWFSLALSIFLFYLYVRKNTY
jgi:surfeit locus 1 family protein